ncbi:MMPL family transporter [Streptomyces sp. NBC_00691]|uniref:MMPL family transporter n=1 Tax=Streptomyces sp. NBC_00691 TaxID=2903671 RepID=UPI002E2F1639|nr:MMPL family transporter [Streptomyces sp. NBC_00691]
MATFLSALGRLAFRRKGVTLLLWLLVFVGMGVAASSAPAPPPDTFSMPGTESQEAFDLLTEKFPDAGVDGATARVVVRAPEGTKITTPSARTRVDRLVAELGTSSPQVVGVANPYTSPAVSISEDGTTAYLVVTYEVPAAAVDDAAHDALDAATEHARAAGLTVEAGGDAVKIEQAMGGTGEQIGVLVSAFVLVLTFGSMIAAGMPLITALIGVGIGISGITALGSTFGLSGTTSTLAMMIGLAVGIDYALFIVSRFRTERAEGRTPEEAAGRAVGTAGSAVVFAGLTVIVALAGLAVVDIPMLTKMGLAAAGTVAVAVLVAITLVPALLGLAPVKVMARKGRLRYAVKPLSDRQRRRAARHEAKLARRTKPNLGTRWARYVLRHPVVVLLVGVIGLGTVAVPAASLELGLPGEGQMSTRTTQRKAYDLLSESFGPGFNGPLTVTVQTLPTDSANARTAATAPDTAAATADEIGKVLARTPGVASVSPATADRTGDTALLTVVPTTGPTEKETEELVHALRDTADDLERTTAARILVTGQTALFIDFSQTLDDALLPYLALVVGLAFLLLMVVFRSVLVPLKAALGFLLSVAAALGAVVAVFQWGWLADVFGIDAPGPIMSTMPIFMIGVVFGLAMDYEVFLVSRMRESYAQGARPGEAVVDGFRHGGRVVGAAAVIMMSVFSGFIVEDNDFVKMIGFALAIAVLFDAFVVRMAIVPALFALLGRSAWWLPKWLDRVLPRVDVEGEKLTGAQTAPRSPRESTPVG